MEVYLYQLEIYCADCGEKIRLAPANDFLKGPFPNGGGEADSPQHCAGCRTPLENPLTIWGVEYVIEAIRNHTDNGRGIREVLKGWAEQVEDYYLNPGQQEILDRFNADQVGEGKTE